jgi:predicted ATPase
VSATGFERIVFAEPVTNGLKGQSLLQRQNADPADESRFLMLEIIREFAYEQLRASNILAFLRQRHVEYFTAWSERAESHLYGPDQAAWLTRLELDGDNLRAALSWALGAGQVEATARMDCALAVFWRRRGLYSEGCNWLEKVLPRMHTNSLPDSLQAKTLQAAGSLARRQGD